MSRALKRGDDDGVYRQMLRAISTGHSIGQKLRGAMFVAGLLTDRKCYAETVVQFYTATEALERQLGTTAAAAGGQRVRQELKQLGLKFSDGYELDLAVLLGPDWRRKVPELQSNAAKQYVKQITATADDDGPVLAAAAFILWGPLVIGGGKSLQRKIAKAFGDDVTHVFAPICKLPNSEHDALKDLFANCMDGLPGEGVTADAMVQHAQSFMEMNNALMRSVHFRPYWWSYVMYGAVAAVVSVLLALLYQFHFRVPLYEY